MTKLFLTTFDGNYTGPAIQAVLDERDRQDTKWGEQNHDLGIWGLVLGEEVGEWCEAILHWRAVSGRAENVEGLTGAASEEWGHVRHEAVQVAAVAVAIIEYMDRHTAGRDAA